MSGSSRPWLPFGLVLLGVGVLVWTNLKGHEYYYPGEPGQPLGDAVVEFVAGRDGRYEIDQDVSAGDLTFTVVEADTDRAIPVDALGLLTALVQTEGRRAWAFEARAGQRYRITTQPWPVAGKLTLDYRDTRAVAWWILGGYLLAVPALGYAVLFWLIPAILAGQRMAASRPHPESQSPV